MRTATLSPYTRFRLATQYEPLPADDQPNAERRVNSAKEVSAYRCPVCTSLHADEYDAERCCPFESDGAKGVHDQEAAQHCPVCQAQHRTEREAVDCCLWRDIDAPTRWRIADAVEAGATWVEAIEAATDQRITQ